VLLSKNKSRLNFRNVSTLYHAVQNTKHSTHKSTDNKYCLVVTHYFKDFNRPLVDYFIMLLYFVHCFITDKIKHLMHITVTCMEDVQ
jgi:hypothetical protein